MEGWCAAKFGSTHSLEFVNGWGGGAPSIQPSPPPKHCAMPPLRSRRLCASLDISSSGKVVPGQSQCREKGGRRARARARAVSEAGAARSCCARVAPRAGGLDGGLVQRAAPGGSSDGITPPPQPHHHQTAALIHAQRVVFTITAGRANRARPPGRLIIISSEAVLYGTNLSRRREDHTKQVAKKEPPAASSRGVPAGMTE